MILLWSFCGVAAAYCIGRYNQSNKLFWTLFTSFVLGISVAAVYNKYVQSDKVEAHQITQVCPTQDVPSTNMNCVTFEVGQVVCNDLPTPVGKELTPEYYLSVGGHQWVKQPIIPPPRTT